MPERDTPADEWGIVEVFGHIRLAGRMTEVERWGTTMMQLDIPGDDADFRATQFLGGGSLFRVTPTDEATARRVALSLAPPVHRYELPAGPDPDTWVDPDSEYDEEPVN